jgi:hypothetical protein
MLSHYLRLLRPVLFNMKNGNRRYLHAFEVAQLANLVFDEASTVDEVTKLIRSLNDFHDDQVQKALDIVVGIKDRARLM